MDLFKYKKLCLKLLTFGPVFSQLQRYFNVPGVYFERPIFSPIPVCARFLLILFMQAFHLEELVGSTDIYLLDQILKGRYRKNQVLLDAGCDIEPENIASMDDSTQPDVITPVSTYQDDEAYHSARDRIVAQFERNYLRWLVSRARGNMSKAARIAGVDRTTLYRLMEKHELQRDTLVTMI